MHKILLILLALFSFTSILSPIASFALDVGDIAPAFTIQSTHGEISLSDYAGEKHIVLALYFAVFTPVWAQELADFQRDLEAFEKRDAQIIGISNDSIETLQKYMEEEHISFPLASDSQKTVRQLYGRGRITFLIDKDGIIRFMQKGVPNNEDFIKRIEMLESAL